MDGAKEKQKILIVDDERSNILALNQILKPYYSTLAAINGQTAIEIAKRSMPDLILLDVVMPEMTGFEVLSELKHEELTNKIPVIIITGLDSLEDEEMGFFLGAVDYITKPFHNSIVRARVKTHLQITEYIHEIELFGMTDMLTNLPNRRSFNSRMDIEWKRTIREKNPISILMIDIDKFKVYNDTYGHPQGDVVLRSVADIFSETLKRGSDFVARWGGEEFIALLPNTDLDGALKVAEAMRANIEEACINCQNGASTFVTVSIGVNSLTPEVEHTIVDFISKADKAMYTAKNMGRNQVYAG